MILRDAASLLFRMRVRGRNENVNDQHETSDETELATPGHHAEIGILPASSAGIALENRWNHYGLRQLHDQPVADRHAAVHAGGEF
jgi:hypothetical protein